MTVLIRPVTEDIVRESFRTEPPAYYGPMERVVSDSPVIFQRKVWIAETRMKKLLQYRNLTGMLSLFLLALALILPTKGFSYEPALALFLAVFGTFVVFTMKVVDAR